MKQQELIVEKSDNGTRLDKYLSGVRAKVSRQKWQNFIVSGNVKVNEKKVSANYSLKTNDKISIALPKPSQNKKVNSSNIVIPIIYEDSEALVINKPANIVVYPPSGSNDFSIIDYFADILPSSSAGFGVVHRLDRDTSGVMILAKSASAREHLMSEFATRTVRKTYTVLVRGHMRHKEAELRLPIARDRKDYRKRVVDSSGKDATTIYKLKHRYTDYDLLKIKLLTGRTHQIRVQLAYLKHPVVGDSLYGTGQASLSRQFVHASELTIKMPQGTKKTFTAPLADDLKSFLLTL